MFFLAYVLHELTRRKARTLTAVGCVAVSTALVICVTAIGQGVNATQSQVLSPLSAIGADLVVTRDASAAGSGSQDVVAQNAEAVKTDLSQLGSPGDHFRRDFFLPGTQLTMTVDLARQVASAAGAEAYSPALAMVVVHQEGTVPKIVAAFQTGGQTIHVDQPIAPMTQAEVNQTNACIARLQGPVITPPPGSPAGKTAYGPPTPEQIQSCVPDRFRHFQANIVTPQQTITQVLNPPQTDITSRNFSVLGLDPTHTPAALSRSQIVAGSYFSSDATVAAGEAIVSESYASSHDLSVGSALTLKGTTLSVIGLARSVIGVQAADVYVSLAALQQMSGQDGNANVLFLRLRQGADVDAAVRSIKSAYPNLVVTSNRDLANRVNGSVTAAASLAARGTGLLASIVFLVAVMIVSLLVWLGVHTRTRELGTLRAIGWSRFHLVRQVTTESLVLSAAGALTGSLLGIGAARALGAWLPPLSATLAAGSNEPAQFGLGNLAPALGSAATLRIGVTPNADIVMAAVALAIVIGIIAAAIGTTEAARVQPIRAVQRLT